MRSPLGALATLVNKAPVPYAGRYQSRAPWWRPAGAEAQLRSMGSVGTLFAIVDRNATSTAAPEWRMYRTAKPGQAPEDRQEVTSHAALDLWRRPNRFYTRSLLVETGQQHFELVGETWWVIYRDPRFKIPLELWPVRPDRMEPQPDHDDYLVGYWYCGPDGERIPLGLDEVIQIRRPNPIDPYRGIGAVQTIRADLEGVRLSAEWNRNFFMNSAEPGGLLQVERRLSDDEFNEMRDRWAEQHQGTSNAHRVSIIENGVQWVDRKYTNRDMQFAELRDVGSKVIREAYGMPKFAVGDLDDVNRATADAAATWFAREMTVPRLERIKQALNMQLLPMFGATGVGVEFDYCSPVPEDREAEREDLTAKATAAQALIDAGAYGPEVLAALGLPEVAFGQPGSDPNRELLIDLVKGAPAQLAPLLLPLLGIDVPTPAPAPAGPPAPAREDAPPPAEDEPEQARAVSLFDLRRLSLAAAQDDADNPLAGVRGDLEAALDDLMDAWARDILPGQIDALTRQITAAVDDGDLARLSTLTVVTTDAANLLRRALADMADTAAARMADEAAAQGVRVDVPAVDPGVTARFGPGLLVDFGAELAAIGIATAAMLGADLASSAGREALRLFTPGAAGAAIAGKVKGFLNKLKGTLRRDQLGGALHRATNIGRLATLQAAPEAVYIATEVNDVDRCEPCGELDGTEFTDLAEAWATYAGGGYAECLGGNRCRGTIHADWRAPGPEGS